MMDFFFSYRDDIVSLLIRLVLGILFFMQGYDKVFGLGLKQSEQGVAEAMRHTRLPGTLVKLFVALSSFIELSGGLLLVAGLYIYPVLALLGLDLLLVVFAMSLREPLWDMRFVWPRLVLLCVLFLIPEARDRFSLDYFLNMYGPGSVTAVG